MALPLTVIDTTVVIDVLRGSRSAMDWIASLDRRLVASEVTRVEILRGLLSGERGAASAERRSAERRSARPRACAGRP